MSFWCVVLFVIEVHCWSREIGLTTSGLKYVHHLDDVAHFGDGQHRGDKWYDLKSSTDDESEKSDMNSRLFSSDSSISTSSITDSDDSSSEASSAETKERRKATQSYRTCNPCPHDMLKGHKNIGIKWLCAGYQRARRSFKSECMMRYRNCQDGTLFVKLYDHRCRNDSFHGKHWFYVYKV